MRINLNGLLAALLVFAGLSGCESVDVTRVQPNNAQVAFSTYAWGTSALSDVPEASAQLVELDEELRQSVSQLMIARGYRLVDSAKRADMVLDYQIAVIEEEFASGENPSSWEAQFDNNTPSGVVDLPARSGAPRVTLSLGLGREGGSAIWGGSATKLMTRPEDQAERQRIINNAVGELLQNLPPAI